MIEYEKNTTGKRLRLWRKQSARLKLIELSQKINVAASSLSELENEKSLPSAETLEKLCNITNLNIVWLLTGRGNMLTDKSVAEEEYAVNEDMQPYQKDNKLNELIKKVIRVYTEGAPEKVAHLKGFLEGADPSGR